MGGEDEGKTSVRLKNQLIKFKNDMLIKKRFQGQTQGLSLFFFSHLFCPSSQINFYLQDNNISNDGMHVKLLRDFSHVILYCFQWLFWRFSDLIQKNYSVIS